MRVRSSHNLALYFYRFVFRHEGLHYEPGDEVGDAIELFSREGISIAYLYSFLLGGKGVLIFRTDNAEKATKVILDNKLKYFEEKDLSKLA